MARLTATFKLTKSFIDKLAAPTASGRPRLVWDSEFHGLGVIVSGVSNAKSWVVQPSVGDRRRRTLGPCNVLSRDQAWELAKPILLASYAGQPVVAKRRQAGVTVQEVLTAYLAQRLSANTRAIYTRLASQHLASWLPRPLASIGPDEVEARFHEITKEVAARKAAGKLHGGVNVDGRASANLTLQLFRALWAYQAERDERLPRNPVSRLRRQWHKLERRSRRIWDQDLAQFFAAVQTLPATLRDIVLCALYSGMREGEIIGLQWSEVDLIHRILTLPPSRMKGGSTFVLPLSNQLYNLLVARRALNHASPFVFPSEVSKSGHSEAFGYALDQLKDTIGPLSPHDLRRSYATLASSLVSAHALKRLLGHSARDITDGYIVLSLEQLRASAQLVADAIDRLVGGNVVELRGAGGTSRGAVL